MFYRDAYRLVILDIDYYIFTFRSRGISGGSSASAILRAGLPLPAVLRILLIIKYHSIYDSCLS